MRQALEGLEGAKEVTVSLESGEAVVTIDRPPPHSVMEKVVLDTAWWPRLRGVVEKITGKLR